MHRLSVYAMRLRHLWTAYLLAMLFHVQLGLMPLFHGLSPEIESKVPEANLGLVFWGMLIYFLIPLASLLLTAYSDVRQSRSSAREMLWKRWRALHFAISVIYTITNIPHLIADIVIPDSRTDQVCLMVVLLIIGLLINREAWLWMRAGRTRRPASHGSAA